MSDYPTITAQDARGGQIRPEDIMLARRVRSNMMTMATMEEEIESGLRKMHSLKPDADWQGFRVGFVAGVFWARCQAENETSSQAVGNMSQYPGEAEDPEEEC